MQETRLAGRSLILAALLASAAWFVQGAAAGPKQRGKPSLPRRSAPNAPAYRANEIVVRAQPGVSGEQIAALVGGQLLLQLRHTANTYVIQVPGDAAQAATVARQLPEVSLASPNLLYQLHAVPAVTPNDPDFNLQWNMRQVGGDTLWGVSVGQRLTAGPVNQVTVAVIDTGVSLNHPDLIDNLLPGGEDFNDFDGDPSDEFGHGTAVAGCVAAVSNNSLGVVSLPWEGVKILPVKIFDAFASTTLAAILDGINFSVAQGVDVINMSFGRSFLAGPDPQEQAVIEAAYNAGVFLVGSSGNSRFFGFSFGVGFPAAYPEVIAVGATGRNGELSSFSDGGPELDLVAPGGNDSTGFDISQQIWTTAFDPFFNENFYAGTQGTSFSSPTVAGAIATLISQGVDNPALPPTARIEDLRQLIKSTATPPAGGPNNDFGAGILNVAAALQSRTVWMDVQNPVKSSITPSFTDQFLATINQPSAIPTLDFNQFSLLRNGVDVTSFMDILDPTAGIVRFQPNSVFRNALGVNTFNLTAVSNLNGEVRSLEGPAVGNIPARSFSIRVLPRTEIAGLKMFGVPYGLHPDGNTLNFLMGNNLVRLARWLPDQNRYAIFDIAGVPQEPQAALLTTDSGVDDPPKGTGWWARVVAPTQIQLLGITDLSPTYEIPIKRGFNMVATPYPFRIAYNVLSVRVGLETMSIGEAVNRGFIHNALWRFEGTRYTFKLIPNGELIPWESHWIQAFRDVTLIVPRVASSGLVSGPTASANGPAARSRRRRGGWRIPVTISLGDDVVGEVFIGQNRGARDKYDAQDVQMPPPPPTLVTLGIPHSDWGRRNGSYMQDIRSARNRAQQWTLAVQTAQAGIPVTVSWGKLPPKTRLEIQVGENGSWQRLINGDSIEFAPQQAGVTTVKIRTKLRIRRRRK